MMSPVIYLASGSPRRRELLEQIQVPFSLLVEAVDETPCFGEAPADYVQRMAREKALAGEMRRQREGLPLLPVLAADTSVILEEKILGKPRNRAEGVAMLRSLGGRKHQVMTALALYSGGEVNVRLSITDVWMAPIDEALALQYWQTGEPGDKAGSYGIQGLAAALVERIEGSYSGVVGLPLAETAQLLQSQGIEVWQTEQ